MFLACRPRPPWSMRSLVALAAVQTCLLAIPPSAFAAYNDTVVLTNGDRMKGEVKNLQQGKLEFKTDAFSTVYIKWDRVAEILAPEMFEVETVDGSRYWGSLEFAGPGTLGLALGGSAVKLELAEVVRITLIKRTFWSRIDGSVDLGASYAKSSGIGQGSLAVDIRTRKPNFEVGTQFDTTITVQPDQPVSSRSTLTAGYARLLKNRWFVPGTGKLERNTDIGLRLRSSAAGGLGRYFVQTNRSQFGAASGLVLNREIPVDGETTNNLEVFVGARYSFFTYDRPKTNITVSFSVFPSLSVEDRFRTDFNITLRRELLKDFTVGFTYYDTYDNKPSGGGAPAHDYGGTVTVGWIF